MTWFRIRKILFGNWRNKGVALLFAVTIWVVAYQAETQSGTIPVRLECFLPTEKWVIVRQERIDPRGILVPFDRTVVLTLSGPRKEIERLRADGTPREVRYPLEIGKDPDPGRKRVELSSSAFPFMPPGVKIVSVDPAAVHLTLDAADEREFTVEPIYQGLPEGMEATSVAIEPARVMLFGPKGILDQVRVTAEALLRFGEVEKRIENIVPLTLRYPETVEKALVESKVRFLGPSEVKVGLQLRFKSDFFEVDRIPVQFLIPGANFPFRIRFDDETLAVRFQGPVLEIGRLKERVKSPDFVLAVRVPPPAGEAEQTITFTEDRLLLHGASERVQILQHSERLAQGKGAWSYSLIPMAPASGARGH